MATPTYIPIATQNITTNTANFTFSEVPQTFRDLICVVSGTISATQDVSLNVINGSGQSIVTHHMIGTGSSSSATQGSIGNLTVNIGPQSGDRYSLILQLFDYAQTNKHKSFLSRYSNSSRGANLCTGRWESTAAITSFNLEGFFAANTTLTLYGVN